MIHHGSGMPDSGSHGSSGSSPAPPSHQLIPGGCSVVGNPFLGSTCPDVRPLGFISVALYNETVARKSRNK